MSYPTEVLLPSDAKYIGFVDDKIPFNSNWDIVWSFSYALTGSQHGFCTFLTTNSSLTGGIPGQYLGYLGESPNYTTNGVLSIAFDSTGYFALSSNSNSGVSVVDVIPNSLIIRDNSDQVIYNQSLSSLDTEFLISETPKTYKTLRFRLSNGGRMLYIDYKGFQKKYKNLLSLPISFDISTYNTLYPGFTFCSPISSASLQPSTLFLKNFHTQGCMLDPTYETVTCVPLSSANVKTYSTISGIL